MAFLTFKEILELIDRVADRGIALVEVESAGVKVRVKGKRAEAAPVAPMQTAATQPAFPPPLVPGAAPPFAATPVEEEEEGLYVVTSPIVGTFYRAANPEATPFVNPGDRIAKGDVLCIIEAMKLMNEIESDIDGVLVKIFPQNGQPIEFGEKLFAVRLG